MKRTKIVCTVGPGTDKFGILEDMMRAGRDVEKNVLSRALYQVLAQDPPVILLGYREILSASSARVTGFKPDIYNGLTGSLPDVKIVK